MLLWCLVLLFVILFVCGRYCALYIFGFRVGFGLIYCVLAIWGFVDCLFCGVT